MLRLLAFATTASALKVTVCGGSGFVGSRVTKSLVESGNAVTAVSKSGTAPAWAAGEAWVNDVTWVKNDFTRGARAALESAIGEPDALVSCVGAVGFDRQQLILANGKANAEIAKVAAKMPGLKNVVYVSVSNEVDESVGWLTGRSLRSNSWRWGEGYFEGKRQAEAAFSSLDATTCFIKPTFIYGGDSFELFPPRVNNGYGSGVEELLSNDIIKKIADVAPGLIKVALRPPVSVDAVAGAAAKAAVGSVSGSLDGTVAINAAADQPAATGLSDAIAGIKEKVSELTASK
jgi:nucleoside-diphosphate-sugar epimerase